ncbi:MAG: AAA family ATPase [Aeromonas jandaei]
MAVKRKKNVIRALLEDYAFMILGKEKSGKTTLFFELTTAKYGTTDAGAIIPFEKGYSALNDALVLTTEDEITGEPKPFIDEWEQFVEIVDDLVENRMTDYADTKALLIDTADRFYKSVEAYTISESVRLTKKPCKSINDAFAGFGRGKAFMLEEAYKQLQRLRNAGYGLFYALHVKYKNVKKDGDGEGYDIMGSNMTEDLFKNLAQDCDFICAITEEKEIKEGKLVGNKRAIRFTSDGFWTAGSRFSKYLPESINYGTSEFLEAFDNAIMQAGNFDKDELIRQVAEQTEARKTSIKAFIQDDKAQKSNDLRGKLVKDFADLTPQLPAHMKQALVEKLTTTNCKNIEEFFDKFGADETTAMYNKLANNI